LFSTGRRKVRIYRRVARSPIRRIAHLGPPADFRSGVLADVTVRVPLNGIHTGWIDRIAALFICLLPPLPD